MPPSSNPTSGSLRVKLPLVGGCGSSSGRADLFLSLLVVGSWLSSSGGEDELHLGPVSPCLDVRM